MAELSRKGILEEAVALADEQGLSAVTFRAVADRLDAHFTSIRHYFPTKDDLVAAMADALLSEAWQVPARANDWRQVLRSLARGIHQVASRHPGAISVLTQRAAAGPAALDVVERCLESLEGGGFTRRRAALAFATFNSLVLGLMLQDVAATTDTEDAEPSVDAATHPRVARLPDVAARRQWDFAVDALIRGLDQSTS